jgi:hypothetical protein
MLAPDKSGPAGTAHHKNRKPNGLWNPGHEGHSNKRHTFARALHRFRAGRTDTHPFFTRTRHKKHLQTNNPADKGTAKKISPKTELIFAMMQ